MTTKYTRKQYMNKEVSHQEYYLQFATESTKLFVENRIGLEKIAKSEDKNLNDVTPMGRNGWVWDYTPFNLDLARELGEVGKNSIPSPATCTCIGKAMARELLKQVKG